MHCFQTNLTRQHYILLCFIAVYVPSNVIFRRLTFDAQTAIQQVFVDRIVLCFVLVTGPLFWAMFALVLQPRDVESRIWTCSRTW
jgi:hypothetical protein